MNYDYIPSKKTPKPNTKKYSKCDYVRNITRHAMLVLFFMLVIF